LVRAPCSVDVQGREHKKWLATPEGWARCTLLLHTLRSPPEKDSLREVALTYFLQVRDDIEHAKLRASVQALIDPSKAKEAFDDYMRIAFPYLETVKQRDKNTLLEVLSQEVAKGGLTVTEIDTGKRKKAVAVTTVSREEYNKARQADVTNNMSQQDMNKIYSRLRRKM